MIVVTGLAVTDTVGPPSPQLSPPPHLFGQSINFVWMLTLCHPLPQGVNSDYCKTKTVALFLASDGVKSGHVLQASDPQVEGSLLAPGNISFLLKKNSRENSPCSSAGFY